LRRKDVLGRDKSAVAGPGPWLDWRLGSSMVPGAEVGMVDVVCPAASVVPGPEVPPPLRGVYV